MEMYKITIVTGKKHSGKTTYLKKTVEELHLAGKSCKGFYAKGFINQKGERTSFNIIDIETKEQKELMSSIKKSEKKTGRFYLNETGYKFGKKILEKAISSECDYVVIDEIGIAELQNKMWAEYLKHLLNQKNKKIIITVRKKILQEIISFFKINNYTYKIIDIQAV